MVDLAVVVPEEMHATFPRTRVFRDPPSKAMQVRINDYTSRQGVLLSQARYPPPPDDLFEQEEGDGYSVEEGSATTTSTMSLGTTPGTTEEEEAQEGY